MKREVTVYDSTKNGHMTVFKDVEVNTLRDLKDLLDKEGIDYTNVVFNEGVTGTRLLHDDSVIPDNIPFKGEIIHDVFINMMMQDNKVSSGAYSRSELYEMAKPFTDEIKEKYGKHYTNLSTQVLMQALRELGCKIEDIDSKCVGNTAKFDSEYAAPTIEEAVEILKSAIFREVNAEVNARLQAREEKSKEEPKSSFSKEDINLFLSR